MELENIVANTVYLKAREGKTLVHDELLNSTRLQAPFMIWILVRFKDIVDQRRIH